MNKLSILNIFVLFALYNINLIFCGERFDESRFTNNPVSRFDNVPVNPTEEQADRIHIPVGNFFAYNSKNQHYNACNTEQENVCFDSHYQSILSFASLAHIIKQSKTWHLRQLRANQQGITLYSPLFIPIQNIPQGFLENKKNQNNFPFYAIDNQGCLYKCEFPESSEYKINTNQTPSIPQESFIVSSFRKYPNLMIGITGITLAAVVISSWKFADKLFGTSWIMVAINKIYGTNYHTKI